MMKRLFPLIIIKIPHKTTPKKKIYFQSKLIEKILIKILKQTQKLINKISKINKIFQRFVVRYLVLPWFGCQSKWSKSFRRGFLHLTLFSFSFFFGG
jgi:hypothetical protein